MKNFIEQIHQSIFDPEFYRSVRDRTSPSPWKYYWGLSLTIAVIMTIFTSLPLIPDLNRALHALPGAIAEYYPDDLSLSIVDGKVTTNVPEPYFLPIPSQWRGVFGSATPVTHLAVIDTATPVSAERFREYASFIWVAHDLVVSEDAQGVVHMTALDPKMSLTIDERWVRQGVAVIEPFFAFAAPLLVVLMFTAFSLRFVLNLVYLLPAALLVLLLGRLLRERWTYRTSYRIALHAVTLPLLVEQIFLLLPFGGFQLPFFTTITMLAVVFMNFRSKTGSTPPETPKETSPSA